MPHGQREEQFQAALVAAVKKRSRAIKKRGASLSISSECTVLQEGTFKGGDPESCTTLLISYRVEGAPVALRVRAWGDRWIWIDVRRSSKKGWIWKFTAEGRFIPSKNGVGSIVEMIEQSIHVTFGASSTINQALGKIWDGKLAPGPRLHTLNG